MTSEERQQAQPPADGGATPPRRRRAPAGSTGGETAAAGRKPAAPKRATRAAAKPEAKADRPAPRRSRAAAKPPPQPAPEPAASVSPRSGRAPPRMLQKLRDEVGPALSKEFGYTSPMQVPRPVKIVLNIGLGEALQNPKALESAARDLSLITGQRPVTTRARKSIAAFKLREGVAVGVTVTLRGRRMYEFLDRLISSTLPRIRDFQGLPREAFDGRGNYSLGLREQVIFPEIDYNSIDRIRGLQVVIVTTARSDREGMRLLESLGMPFVRAGQVARVA